MQDIGSETYAHGKVGHYPFSACRYTQRELFAKRGSAECLFLAGIVELGSVILCINVGAGIIDTVQGYSCTEFISEVIHRSETEPGYAVFAGSGDLSAGNVNGFPSPRTEQHKVIANMPGECRNRNLLQRLQDLVNVPVEIICHSDFKIYRVQSGVGVPGIAVGEMYCRCADIEVEPRRQYPVQMNSGIEICIDFGSYNGIIGVGEVIVWFPAERCAESPFVIK